MKKHSAELCTRFHCAIELIGRRWTGAIISVLFSGPSRFAEIRAAIPEITDRMLTERLQELESHGIVVRTVLDGTPIRVEYALSEKGEALKGPMDEIGEWASEWLTDSEVEAF